MLEPSSTNSVAVIVFVAIAVVAVAQLAATFFIVVVLLWEPCFRSGADFSVFFCVDSSPSHRFFASMLEPSSTNSVALHRGGSGQPMRRFRQ